MSFLDAFAVDKAAKIAKGKWRIFIFTLKCANLWWWIFSLPSFDVFFLINHGVLHLIIDKFAKLKKNSRDGNAPMISHLANYAFTGIKTYKWEASAWRLNWVVLNKFFNSVFNTKLQVQHKIIVSLIQVVGLSASHAGDIDVQTIWSATIHGKCICEFHFKIFTSGALGVNSNFIIHQINPHEFPSQYP